MAAEENTYHIGRCANDPVIFIVHGSEENLPRMICGRPQAKRFDAARTPETSGKHPSLNPFLNECSTPSEAQARHGMAQQATAMGRHE
jgi:hypothetical protein